MIKVTKKLNIISIKEIHLIKNLNDDPIKNITDERSNNFYFNR